MANKNKVILVDDDEDLLRLLVFAFQGKGFEVKTLTRGKEALEYLLEEKNLESVSILLLDRVLPDMDGLEILQKFRTKFNNRIPVLILSALSAEKDILEGLKWGAIDYVSKPFSLAILMQKALSLIQKNV